MDIKTWAEREAAIRIEFERKDKDTDESFFNYGTACVESALKAFNCLMEDGHSGMSIGFTKAFLNRLIDGKPLTPIEDTDDIWEFIWEHDGVKTYQCTRMSSLFKDEYSDGTVKYHDVDRVNRFFGESGGVMEEIDEDEYITRIKADVRKNK